MRTGRLVRICVLGAGLVAGCASHTRPGPVQARPEPDRLPGKEACFWTSAISDWIVLDDSTLIVTAPLPKDAYLVKLFAPVPDLSFRQRLGFQSEPGEPGRFCRENGYVFELGAVPQRWPVAAVRALTPEEAKRLLDGTGGQASHRPDQPETPQPGTQPPRPR
jgi:hypothetical protein